TAVSLPRFDRQEDAIEIVVLAPVHHAEKITDGGLDVGLLRIVEKNADHRLSVPFKDLRGCHPDVTDDTGAIEVCVDRLRVRGEQLRDADAIGDAMFG